MPPMSGTNFEDSANWLSDGRHVEPSTRSVPLRDAAAQWWICIIGLRMVERTTGAKGSAMSQICVSVPPAQNARACATSA